MIEPQPLFDLNSYGNSADTPVWRREVLRHIAQALASRLCSQVEFSWQGLGEHTNGWAVGVTVTSRSVYREGRTFKLKKQPDCAPFDLSASRTSDQLEYTLSGFFDLPMWRGSSLEELIDQILRYLLLSQQFEGVHDDDLD